VATKDEHDTREGNGEKKDGPREAQILAMCVGFWLGLGLVAGFFLGWVVGTAIVGLGLGSTLILIDVAFNRRRGHDGQ
jgi:hypothetical protein